MLPGLLAFSRALWAGPRMRPAVTTPASGEEAPWSRPHPKASADWASSQRIGSPKFQGIKPGFPGPKDSHTSHDLPGAPHGGQNTDSAMQLRLRRPL